MIFDGLELITKFVYIFEDKSILLLLFKEDICYLLEIIDTTLLFYLLETVFDFLHVFFIKVNDSDFLFVLMIFWLGILSFFHLIEFKIKIATF